MNYFYPSRDTNLLASMKQVLQWQYSPLYCMNSQHTEAVLPLFRREDTQPFHSEMFHCSFLSSWKWYMRTIHLSLQRNLCTLPGSALLVFEQDKRQTAQQIKKHPLLNQCIYCPQKRMKVDMVALKCVCSVIRQYVLSRGKVKFRWQENNGKSRGTLLQMRVIRKVESAAAVLTPSAPSTAQAQ